MSFRGQGYGPQSAASGSYGAGGSGRKNTAQFEEDEDYELEDEAYEGVNEHPPFLKIGIGLCEFVVGLLSNAVQITTSTYAFMSSMQGSAVRVLNIKDLLAIGPPLFMMSLTIALGVQLILHMNSQDMSSTWRRLRHIKIEQVDARAARSAIQRQLTARSLLFKACLFLDVIGDGRFATLYTTEWLAVAAWIILLTSLSTIVMYDGAVRAWGGMQDARDHQLHHQRHYQ